MGFLLRTSGPAMVTSARPGGPSTLRRTLSCMRHADPEEDVLARGYAVTHPTGAVVLPAGPGWDQLIFAAGGVMTAHSPAGVLVVPPHRALWLPDGVPYRLV